ncbi:hypothetical protein [Novosphingobium album (ex Liu et al. 2023)]|uniref:hypothetical protein n=1 Tax=Novosphingobium album (ex Liu et al. 2023) TaxID=3031130 RepID=UPI0023B08144|nr:hypothetical protein [Novosphingobium album (ex Liu et al. 2023)]
MGILAARTVPIFVRYFIIRTQVQIAPAAICRHPALGLAAEIGESHQRTKAGAARDTPPATTRGQP